MRSALLLIWSALLLTGLPSLGPVAVAAPLPPAPPVGLERFVIVPGESQVAYHVGEVFFNQNHQFHLATGVTRSLRGEVLIDPAHPRRSRVGPITVDISQFASDSAQRDGVIRGRWLESSRFPIAEFTPTAIQGLPDEDVQGRNIPLQITGNLRIRDVTRPVTFDVSLKLEGKTLTGVATTKILMTDFGFDPPSLLGILKAGNEVNLGFRFTARAAE
jgi:polyisoprenoid-binding protein YceI